MRSYAVRRNGASAKGVVGAATEELNASLVLSSWDVGFLIVSKWEGVFRSPRKVKKGGLEGFLSARSSSKREEIFWPSFEGVLGPGFVLASRRSDYLLILACYSIVEDFFYWAENIELWYAEPLGHICIILSHSLWINRRSSRSWVINFFSLINHQTLPRKCFGKLRHRLWNDSIAHKYDSMWKLFFSWSIGHTPWMDQLQVQIVSMPYDF